MLNAKILAKHFSLLKIDFYIFKILYHRCFGDSLIHSLFSLLGPGTPVVNCNTDYEAERRIIGVIQGLLSGIRTEK